MQRAEHSRVKIPPHPRLTGMRRSAPQEFCETQEAAAIAAAAAAADTEQGSMRVEPRMGVPGSMLFSHGMAEGEKFGASMSKLHFSDPAARGELR